MQINSGSSGFSGSTLAGLNAAGAPVSGAPAIIDIGGNGTGVGSPVLSWGSQYFNPTAFVLNDSTSNTYVALLNGIDLNTTQGRTFTVNNGTAGGGFAFLNGPITDSAGSAAILKNGAGTLVFNSNLTAGVINSITVSAGTVQLDNNTEIPSTTPIFLAGGSWASPTMAPARALRRSTPRRSLRTSRSKPTAAFSWDESGWASFQQGLHPALPDRHQ